MIRKHINLEEVKAFINAQSPETKVYLGGTHRTAFFRVDNIFEIC